MIGRRDDQQDQREMFLPYIGGKRERVREQHGCLALDDDVHVHLNNSV